MQRRPSGVWVEARGDITLAATDPALQRVSFGRSHSQSASSQGHGSTRATPPPSEEEVILSALETQDLGLVDVIQVLGHAPPRATSGSTRRGAKPARPESSKIEMAVPTVHGQSAVLLIDQGGVYEWKLPDSSRKPTDPETMPPPARSTRRQAAAPSPPATAQTLVFDIPIASGQATISRRANGPSQRGALLNLLGESRAVVYVFRFVVGKVLSGVTHILEENVREGLIHIGGTSPEDWHHVGDPSTLTVPSDRPARILLMVHGTFSSTIGSFAALAGQADGLAFLKAATGYYDLVLGYDHRTLAALPSENGSMLADCLANIGFRQPPIVDAISFSRGALVLRWLIECILPKHTLRLVMQRAIFVGATNGGTELANSKNWHRFADSYINIAAAGARASALIPGFTSAGLILASAIGGVAALVKVLANSAIDDRAIPGLAAMQPKGSFIENINALQPGEPTPAEANYFAITSNFDPEMARTSISPDVMTPRLLLKLADKAADAFYGEPNDLVVHVESMTQINPEVGRFIRDTFDFGTNGTVHHCGYFSQPETARHLTTWLQLDAALISKASTILKLHSNDPVNVALARVRKVGKPWVVVERPFEENQQEITLRYAYPATLAEEWLKNAADTPDASVFHAFNLKETSRSHEVPAGTDTPLFGPDDDPSPDLKTPFGSHFRMIAMEDGEPVDVISPGESVARIAPPGKRRATRSRGPAASSPPVAFEPRVFPSPDLAELPIAKKPATKINDLPDATQVECHFRAETDAKFVVEKVHTVLVTISREELDAVRDAVAADGSARVRTDRKLIVECMPMLRARLDNLDDYRVEIEVPPPGKPTLLSFDLRGNEPGKAQVRVQVRQGPMPLVTLALDFEVVKKATGGRRRVSAKEDIHELPSGTEPIDELRIVQTNSSSGTTQYRYELSLPSAAIRKVFESSPLPGDPAQYVSSIHSRIESFWASNHRQKKALIRNMKGIGNTLFMELFPGELRGLLWEHRTAIGSVQVISSEPFIPWELLLVSEPGDVFSPDGSVFLGELGVVRWLQNGYPPTVLRQDTIIYLVPDYPHPNELPGAQKEIDMMKRRGGKPLLPEDAEAFYDLIGRGDFDILHVACHGATDPDDIGAARLGMPVRQVNGTLNEEEIFATTVDISARLGARRPIVVLNACQSARLGPTLRGLGGFAEAFLGRGAGVFIGSGWSIGDQPAYAFVHELYKQFLDNGLPLAAATAAARKAIRDTGDATWLAYVVYGHPRAVALK